MWLVALAACGAPTDQPGDALLDGAQSGTRLKLEYFDFDTTRTLYGLFDAERGERCYLETWADGVTYCTPSDRGPIAYTDASCERAVGIVRREAGCTRPPPAYFSAYHGTCSRSHAHLYPRAEKLPAASYYVRDSTGACSGPAPASDGELYALGPEIAANALVATTQSEPVMAGRLGLRFHESADGMRVPASGELFDASLGASCQPINWTGETATGHCLPSATDAGLFEAGCSTRLASAPATCPAPEFAMVYAACPTAPARYFRAGDELAPAAIYVDTGASCQMLEVSPDLRYFAVGDEVEIAALSRERAGSGGRLEPVYFTTSDGLRVRDFELHDALLQTDCFPSENADGTTVCLPVGTHVSDYFIDEQCSSPIRLASVRRGDASCAPPSLPAFAIEYVLQPACGLAYVVHEVGALYTGGVYQRAGATCSQIVPNDTVFYRLGAQVPTNALVSGTLRVDL
jgi:hypothetical protein